MRENLNDVCPTSIMIFELGSFCEETVQSDAKKNAKKSLAERVKILQESSDDSSDEPLVQNLTKKPTATKPKTTIQVKPLRSLSTFS